MPRKRSSRKRIQQFLCPFCEKRLWRLGGSKHYMYYMEKGQIKKNLQISSKKAGLLATQSPYIDSSRWIEDFFCSEHGLLWLLISKGSEGTLTATLAQQADWEHSTGTVEPNHANPSVSEFSRRMSRRAEGGHLIRYMR